MVNAVPTSGTISQYAAKPIQTSASQAISLHAYEVSAEHCPHHNMGRIGHSAIDDWDGYRVGHRHTGALFVAPHHVPGSVSRVRIDCPQLITAVATPSIKSPDDWLLPAWPRWVRRCRQPCDIVARVSVESTPSVSRVPYPTPSWRASARDTAGAEGWSTTPSFSTFTEASGYTASATASASRKVVLI